MNNKDKEIEFRFINKGYSGSLIDLYAIEYRIKPTKWYQHIFNFWNTIYGKYWEYTDISNKPNNPYITRLCCHYNEIDKIKKMFKTKNDIIKWNKRQYSLYKEGLKKFDEKKSQYPNIIY